MVTKQQLIKNPRRPKRRSTNVPALKGSPQRKGICLKVYTLSPKKPNSANRKVARVRLSSRAKVSSFIPGERHIYNSILLFLFEVVVLKTYLVFVITWFVVSMICMG